MKHGACIHHNGHQHKLCSRGVAYAQFYPGSPCIQTISKSARGGTYLRPGEIPAETKPFPGAQPPERCPFFQLPTDDQVQADRAETEVWLQRTEVALKVAAEWRVRPKPSQDRAEVVECPLCKGKLHLSQSSYNGHVHGACETPDCVRWME
jgi:ssDNA-binding Zn-finger/Zn-ribbon topoisomerase 1